MTVSTYRGENYSLSLTLFSLKRALLDLMEVNGKKNNKKKLFYKTGVFVDL